MTKSLEFWFDIGSPAAYLAWTQLDRIRTETGATLVYRPMLLGGVFKSTGNRPPAAVVAKGQYMLRDLNRFAQRYSVPLVFNPFFPVNTLLVMRGLAALVDSDPFEPTLKVIYQAMWQGQKNLADETVVSALLNDAHLAGDDFVHSAQDPIVKERLKALTDEAVSKGVFGAPTMFVGDEMFFGQDRLDFVVEALTAT